ncbi:MAG: hypothetical protein ACLUSL_03195 [Ruminococcus sp.]
MQFQELNLSAPLLEAVAQLDFTEMTEIQEKTIPLLLEEKMSSVSPIPEPERRLRSAFQFWNRWSRRTAVTFVR